MTRVTCVPLCEQAAAIVRRELQLSPLKETFYFGGSRQRRFRRAALPNSAWFFSAVRMALL